MNNDRQPSTEQPTLVAPVAAPPAEWTQQQQRLIDAVQRLVGAVADLTLAIQRVASRVDEMYVDEEVNGK